MNIKIMKSTLILFCLVPVVLIAQIETTSFAGRGKVGTAGLQFLKIGVSARAVGMGEAFISLADDGSAMFYNPAGLNQIKQREVFFTHTEWPAGINYEYLGACMPVTGIGIVGAQVAVLTTGDMKRTVPYVGWTGEYFSATDWSMGISVARMLTDKFSIGGTVKMVSEWLDGENLTIVAADFGTLFDIGVRGLKFGMSVSNFGGNAKFIKEGFSLPICFKFGGVVDVIKNDLHYMRATVEGAHPNDNLEQIAMGVEYIFNNFFALRSGYRQFVRLTDKDELVRVNGAEFDADEPLEGLSLGFGVNVSVKKLTTKIDYSYSDLGFLDFGQRFTVSFQF